MIVAIAALFLLMLITSIFIGVIGQNLTRSEHNSDIVGAQALSEAGIRYANYMLTYSNDGADWRPAAVDQSAIDNDDPDAEYLRDGYVRFTSGNGRFLIRLRYPGSTDVSSPEAKCIKIESIGRVGVINADDPTTYQNSQPMRMRREMQAYKPIGITDYTFFVTNKDKSDEPATMGIPNLTGMPDNFSNEFVGSMRVNGNLQWIGKNLIHLDRDVTSSMTPSNDPIDFAQSKNGDRISVSGNISFADKDTNVTLEDPYINSGKSADALPSEDTNFSIDPFISNNSTDTPDPIYSDGNGSSDIHGASRWVKRLEPPSIDTENPETGVGRYIALTKFSGVLNSNNHNTGEYGLGNGIYIDNINDIQNNHGDLTDEWLNQDPDNPQPHWNIGRYDPPGVQIVFYPIYSTSGDADAKGIIEITREEPWRDADGNKVSSTRYYKLNLVDGTPEYQIFDVENNKLGESKSFNGIIYAEGNIRVWGQLPSGIPMTMISGGTIYIEGNLVKSDNTAGIALLAKDYVCVNTTQFFRVESDASQTGSYYVISGTDVTKNMVKGSFGFGLTPPSTVKLLVVQKNSGTGSAGVSMQTGIGRSIDISKAFGFSSNDSQWWHMNCLTLMDSGTSNITYDSNLGALTSYRLIPGASTGSDYWLKRIGMQPLDIQIDAVMYAQDKCFFVIPGEWFNPDSTDVRKVYDSNGNLINDVDATNSRVPNQGHRSVDDDFPFYGEPLDVRVWICGAIAENHTAPISAISDWTRKWGWTPLYIGSKMLNNESLHKGFGMTYAYDISLIPSAPTGSDTLAVYQNRPRLPKLPVSPDLIYFGSPNK